MAFTGEDYCFAVKEDIFRQREATEYSLILQAICEQFP